MGTAIVIGAGPGIGLSVARRIAREGLPVGVIAPGVGGHRLGHAASVTVMGEVAPATAFDPDEIAEHHWRLHAQPPGAWEHEVVHGPEASGR
ncbi:MAG: hypothetical protein ACRDPM_13485 [Solirubrobacteraceae bacterium]